MMPQMMGAMDRREPQGPCELLDGAPAGTL